MKFRSFLLVACIVTVPLVAMFSHRVPRGLTARLKTVCLDPLASWLARTHSGSGRVALGSDAATDEPATTPRTDVRPLAEPLAAPAQAVLPMTPLVAPPSTAAHADAHPRAATAAARSALEERLARLGAREIECRSLRGGDVHVGSCRVPVDALGQLERVFQASGPDPLAAITRLLQDVEEWRRHPSAAAERDAVTPVEVRF